MPHFSGPARNSHYEGNQKDHEKQEKQDLRYSGRCGGNPTKSEDGRDNRDQKEYESVVKHC